MNLLILDLEAFLIKYVSADGKYKLQNGNNGLSDFEYFDRREYVPNFLKVWDKLTRTLAFRLGNSMLVVFPG